MELTVIQDRNALQTLETEWNQLVLKSTMDVPFLRYEYIAAWWDTLGGGEWQSGDLRIIAARDKQGRLEGIAPLFRTQSADGEPVLMLIGSIEISDYLDLIVRKENITDFVSLMLDELGRLDESEWNVLDLYNIPDWSDSSAILRDEAKKRGWKVNEEILQPCPMITVNEGWDAYLSALDKKQRHELRRKTRRLESNSGGAHFRIVNREDDLDKEIESYLGLMAQDPRKATFLSPAMRSNISELSRAALENEWLMLAFLDIGGEPAAANMNFDYGNRIWIYNSGINPAYFDISPGWVLLGYTIQWAAEHGRDAVDFMRGDELYKYRLGGVDRHVTRIIINRQG